MPGKRPPGPNVFVPSLSFSAYRRDRIGFLTRLTTRYGDIAAVRGGRNPIVLVNNPDYIQQILVNQHNLFHKGRGLERARRVLGNGLLTSEESAHLRQRRLIQPAFHRERIGAYGAFMAASVLNLQEEWHSGDTIELSEEMFRLTLKVIGRTLFGTELERDIDEIAAGWQALIKYFEVSMSPFSKIADMLPLPSVIRFKAARKHLDSLIYRIIYDHEKGKTQRADLLTMLLAARDEEDHNRKMTPRQVRDEALTLLMAGHETTANALTWTWVLLAQHPEVLDKLHKEIAFVVGERLPTNDDLPRLTYARQVLSESMRLFPPAWVIGRRAMETVEIGGYEIKKGTLLLMSQAVTHRDPRWYSEPDEFDPERWAPGREENRPRFAYFPFGGGPRTCIGEQFAWMELILLMVSIAQRWKLSLAPGAVVAMDPVITLRAKPGLLMLLEARPTSPAPQYVNL